MSVLEDPELLLQIAALMGMAGTCVWVGSKRSNNTEDMETETITNDEALKFPLFASAALLSIYVLFKFVNPEWLALIMTAYFAFVGTGGVQLAIAPQVTGVMSKVVKSAADPMLVMLKDGDTDAATLFKFTRGDVASGVIGAAVSAIYVWSHHWICTNFIAMCIVISGMQIVKLDNFKVACILLTGLFVYDIFWVFGTDVMVTVSRNVDGPIKILFPTDIITTGVGSKKLGLLGLGDIMIPGIVVALLYRFDIKRGGGEGAPTPYFHVAFAAYMVGLIITFIALHVSQHAQPALLYLSPIGIIVPFCHAWLRGELTELFEYSEDGDEKPNDLKEE